MRRLALLLILAACSGGGGAALLARPDAQGRYPVTLAPPEACIRSVVAINVYTLFSLTFEPEGFSSLACPPSMMTIWLSPGLWEITAITTSGESFSERVMVKCLPGIDTSDPVPPGLYCPGGADVGPFEPIPIGTDD